MMLVYAIGGWSAVWAAVSELVGRAFRGVAPDEERCIMGSPVHPWLHCGRRAEYDRDGRESCWCDGAIGSDDHLLFPT